MELLQGPGTFFFPWPRGQGTGRRKKKQVLAPNPLKSQFLLSFGQGILMRFGKSSSKDSEVFSKGLVVFQSRAHPKEGEKWSLAEAKDKKLGL